MRFTITETTLNRYQCDDLQEFIRARQSQYPHWLYAAGQGPYTSGDSHVPGTSFDGKLMPSFQFVPVVEAIIAWLSIHKIAPSESLVDLAERIGAHVAA